jgi:hypothetical protein
MEAGWIFTSLFCPERKMAGTILFKQEAFSHIRGWWIHLLGGRSSEIAEIKGVTRASIARTIKK